MAASSINRSTAYFLALCSFSVGFSLCLLVKGALSSSGWAEALSGIATVIAVVLAILTYVGWQKQKVREDAYITKRLYISTLVQIESTTTQIANSVVSLIPEPGMVAPTDAQAAATLGRIFSQHNELKLHGESLVAVYSELRFWGAALSDASMVDHDGLIYSINSYLIYLHHLQTCLTNFYIHKVSDRSIEHWKTKFIDINKTVYDLFESRKSKNMDTVFMY